MSLYRKYRPNSYEDVVGEDFIISVLRNSLKNNTYSHAYLFSGPRGTGKTTTARLMAKSLNCETGITDTPCNQCPSCQNIDIGHYVDLIEIDGASNRGIDEIRNIKDSINFLPVTGRKKVYIIDEAHMLTKEASNALLKTLEEPPEYIVFILCTTEPDKILETILSRCQKYEFHLNDYASLSSRLIYICKAEGYTIDDESLMILYKKSEGSVRDSLSLLEKLMMNALPSKIIDIKTTSIVFNIIPEYIFIDFINLLKDKTIDSIIEFLNNLIIKNVKIDMFFKDFAVFLKENIFNKSVNIFNVKVAIKLIDIIFDVLNRFKYEDDKRLLGVIIASRIIEIREGKTIIPVSVNNTPEVKEILPPVNINNNQINLQEKTQSPSEDINAIVVKNLKDINITLKAHSLSTQMAFALMKRFEVEGSSIILYFSTDFHKNIIDSNISILKSVFKTYITTEFSIKTILE